MADTRTPLPTPAALHVLRPTSFILGLGCIAMIGGACAPAPRMIPIDCRSIQSMGGTATDTLVVSVHVARSSSRRAPRLLVRVDPLSEPGAVTFQEGTPPTAAAVSAALTPSGTFQGCIAMTPSAFELRAPDAPFSRVWMRVSSNVPVAARLVIGTGEDDARVEVAEVLVSPGASGEAVAKLEAAAREGGTPIARTDP